MEVNTETEIVGVLPVKRPAESQPQSNTPVAKKTRSTMRLRSQDEELPKSHIKTTQALETPRRSARKSVRPQLDYDYIVERSRTRSVSKLTLDTAAEEADNTASKWEAAKVGRHSQKRGHKSKRGTSKHGKKKKQEEEHTEDVKELVEKCTEYLKEQVDKSTEEKMENYTKDSKENDLSEADPQDMQESGDRDNVVHADPQDKQESSDNHNVVVPADPQDKQESGDKDKREPGEKDNVVAQADPQHMQISGDKDNVLAPTDPQIHNVVVPTPGLNLRTSSPKAKMAAKSMEATVPFAVDIKDLDELGLSPLNDDVEPEEEHNDEMPSLILLEDDQANDLNRTFEIDIESTNEPPKEAVEQHTEDDNLMELDMDMPKLQMSPEKHVKIVLTDANDQDKTLLKMEDQDRSHRFKGYRFPTPMKKSSKMNFKFTQESAVMESPRILRRSKSACGVNVEKEKSVCFFSPVEVTGVEDIDMRWEKNNISNVTQRRKRSKSLDTKPPKSRIPKPKFLPVVKAPTPGKLKTRNKLPNFAAIHQKQFDKMENLVEHIERKAVRAKELTSATKKIVTGTASVTKSAIKKVVDVGRSRPQAQKQIMLPSNLLKADESKKVLPTPRKVVVPPVTKSRLPLLSKPVSQIFAVNPTSAIPSSSVSKPRPVPNVDPRAALENKVETRRQRHMQMFKGRIAKPSQNNDDLIRGVRSNRRFQLQMQHRRQMNEMNNN